VFPLLKAIVDLQFAYGLRPRRPPGQVKDLGESILCGGSFGEHAAGFGPSAGGGIDQHGLFDTGQSAPQFPDTEVQAVLVGVAADEVGNLQGQHTGEDMDPMLWSIQWCMGLKETRGGLSSAGSRTRPRIGSGRRR